MIITHIIQYKYIIVISILCKDKIYLKNHLLTYYLIHQVLQIIVHLKEYIIIKKIIIKEIK